MASNKKFTRVDEDFVCERCGAPVAGTGYTNHCPQCLWSKHVDINPGDRQAACGGMMEPVAVEASGSAWRIKHRCARCGFERRQTSSDADNFETILAVARRAADISGSIGR